jgi:hypothetical protein
MVGDRGGAWVTGLGVGAMLAFFRLECRMWTDDSNSRPVVDRAGVPA